MTFQPVFPPLVLIGIAAAILLARITTLRRSRTGAARWRWGGLTLAALLLIVAATRPVIDPDDPSTTRVADREAPNVFLVVDRSPDMRVTDYADGQSRMAVARADVAQLIDRYASARISVISFAARPTLDWPLSVDTWSLKPLTSTFQPYPLAPDAVDQTNAGAAGTMLRYQLIGARQQYPRAKVLVYYLGAGTPEAALPPRDFNLPDGVVDGGAVLGYGTASAIDEPALRGIAAQIGVPYALRSDAEPLASTLPSDPTEVEPATAAAAGGPPGRTETYWAPAGLAAALILVELYLALRDFRRTRLAGDVVIP